MKKIALFLPSLILCVIGVWIAQTRGGAGRDFEVFRYATELISQNKPTWIYSHSPDRFLYAPAFAWIFFPFSALSLKLGLLLWNVLKVGVLLALCHKWATLEKSPWLALAPFVIARPLLIDLQYGQINLLILCVTSLALLDFTHAPKRPASPRQAFWIWFATSLLAISKLYTLPLLLVPFCVSTHSEKKKTASRLGILIGVFIALALPLLAMGIRPGAFLYADWLQALSSRGLPDETHNQSFTGFLIRIFTGIPIRAHVLGPIPRSLNLHWLTSIQVEFFSLAWSLFFVGIIISLIIRGPLNFGQKSSTRWCALLCSLSIIPSHLVWKPYFVFALPIAALSFDHARKSAAAMTAWVLAFVLMNLTTFDLIGVSACFWIEAASGLLWAHLIWGGLTFAQMNSKDNPSR